MKSLIRAIRDRGTNTMSRAARGRSADGWPGTDPPLQVQEKESRNGNPVVPQDDHALHSRRLELPSRREDRLERRHSGLQRDDSGMRDRAAHVDFLGLERVHDHAELRVLENGRVLLHQEGAEGRDGQARRLDVADELQRRLAVGAHRQLRLRQLRGVEEFDPDDVAGSEDVLARERGVPGGGGPLSSPRGPHQARWPRCLHPPP